MYLFVLVGGIGGGVGIVTRSRACTLNYAVIFVLYTPSKISASNATTSNVIPQGMSVFFLPSVYAITVLIPNMFYSVGSPVAVSVEILIP